jgi:hypothetical protein
MQQFVLLADGDIIIDPGVQRLDGIFAARGNVITCSGVAGPASLAFGSPCQTRLRVNGAVIAGLATKPFRFFGASNETGMTYSDPAELFDLNPALYIGEFSRTSGTGTITTVDQREAPPRF